jgi:hypothetical protein
VFFWAVPQNHLLKMPRGSQKVAASSSSTRSVSAVQKDGMLVEKKDGTLDMRYRANQEEARRQEKLNQTAMDCSD